MASHLEKLLSCRMPGVIFQRPNSYEKHIADIYTVNQFVLEIQSYSIDEEEARSRESFYERLIWVINGAKNDFDKIYFNMSLCGPYPDDPSLRNIHWCGRSKLLHKWSRSTKPVFLDFGGDSVWQLLVYDHKQKKGQVRQRLKSEFVLSFGGTYPQRQI